MDEFDFAVPPFKAADALAGLKRSLRELGLAEREGRFERGGVAIAQVTVDGAAIVASVVKKPSRSSPEWQTKALTSGAHVRDFLVHVKKQLAAWSDRDD